MSSHNPLRPAFYGLACAMVAFVIYRRNAASHSLNQELDWWRGGRARIASFVRAHARGWLDPVLLVAAAALWIDILQWWRGAPLWLDEEMIAINFRDRSFADLTGSLWLGQSAPLGWLWLERIALLLSGPAERALRIVPLLFGLGTTLAATWIARRYLTTPAGVLVVVLCVVGSSISHYRFELKHYSADVFWGLLLPALAAWTTEAGSPGERWRRRLTFALVAGVALWTSYGALFVAPGCLAWILADTLRRDRSQALRVTAANALWLSFFAANYALSLRYTHENDFLRNYWSDRVPPASAGPAGRLAWIADQLPELGRNAGGTSFPILLFAAGITGLLLAPARRLSIVYGAVPIAAVLLAVTRLVPVYERFSLWVIPSIYVGLAFALDRGVRWMRHAFVGRRLDLAVAGALACTAVLPVSWDVTKRGWHRLHLKGPAETNHGMDDRRGVAWLMRHRQAGDAIVTTRLGWPAIWWYGAISLSDHPHGGLPDGTRFYELSHDPGQRRCDRIADALQGHRRILYYLSFPDFSDEVLAWLEREVVGLGPLAARQTFGAATWAAVIRADEPAPAGTPRAGPPDLPGGGCMELKPARRW